MSARFFGRKKTFRHLLLACISLSSVVCGAPESSNPKEALILRRITEYWKDGDYDAVKRQIVSFIEHNPDTALYDHLSAMLGDLYFQEKEYRQALATYDLIANPEIKEKTFFNHLQATFEMRDYLSVIERGEKFLRSGRESEHATKVRYLLAEAAFREGLKAPDMEKKAHYLKMAKPHYKLLTQSKYSERVLFPLAEIHRLLREDDRAASLYLGLAEKYPEHRERFLFQAGILQIKGNRQEAIRTFEKVQEIGGKRSRLAAYNRLILLYQTENYEGYLSYLGEVLGSMPEQKVPLLKFYEGRSYYALGDYTQAVTPLEEFVTNSLGTTKELKTALLLLVNCSRYTSDIALLERTLFSYKTSFPKDSEVPRVLMIHAQMSREAGNFAGAQNDLKMLMTEYPSFEDWEAVFYDYGLLLSLTDRWIEARETFLSFLDKYPESERRSAAWRHLLNCSIEEIKSPAQPNSEESKETLVKILEKALSQDKILTSREKEQYGLVLIKCKCELERYDECIPALSQFIADVQDKENLSEAHLLMALCQQKLNHNLRPFIQHAEKALAYNPRCTDHQTLHLELYNAYLMEGTAAEASAQDELFTKAAHHLFASDAWKEKTIKQDNYLWLANHYYYKAKGGDSLAFDRAKVLYDNLLGIKKDEETLQITADSLYLEGEVLKYARMLELHNRSKEKVALLEKLVRKQEAHSELPWKMERRAVLELAKGYEAVRRFEDALNSYTHLAGSKERLGSMVTATAQLHKAKLEYSLMKPQLRVSESPEMIAILHTLKDLQIQKRLRAEPLHLEAALQYAEIRTSFSEPENELKNAHFFLKRMREDFNGKHDPVAEEYNRLRQELPEKNAIFTSYMNYLDAQMLHLEAQMARKEKQLDKATQVEEQAEQILSGMQKHQETLQPYLGDRVKRLKLEIAKYL